MELVKKHEMMIEALNLYNENSPICYKISNESAASFPHRKEDNNNFILCYDFKTSIRNRDYPYIKNITFSEDHIRILLEHCSKKNILFNTKKLHHKIKPYSFSIEKPANTTAQIFTSKKQARKMYRNYIYYCLINDLDFETVNKKILKKYDKHFYKLIK